MKKLFALLLCVTFIFASCGSDDDNVAPSLKNTTWEGIDGDTRILVSFSDLESTMILSGVNVDVSLSASYSYTYEHPKVTMYPKESGKARIEGTVSSDHKTMTVVNTSTGKTIGTIAKK